jgi:predicted RNase H-like nuclease
VRVPENLGSAQQTKEMLIAGIDGAKKGTWLAVTQDTESGQIGAQSVQDLRSFLTATPVLEIVAIDIPIGLTDCGPRDCDVAARKLLGRRGCCVFPAPIRPILKARNHAEANALSMAMQGKGVPIQAFGIFNRVEEVDDLLAAESHLQSKVYEVHPELSFAAWLGTATSPIPLPSKKTPQGLKVRRDLINSHFGATTVDEVRPSLRRGTFAEDDILDAIAALYTASRLLQGNASRCGAAPPLDAFGHVIWF